MGGVGKWGGKVSIGRCWGTILAPQALLIVLCSQDERTFMSQGCFSKTLNESFPPGTPIATPEQSGMAHCQKVLLGREEVWT